MHGMALLQYQLLVKVQNFCDDINSIVDYIVEYVFRNLKPYRTIFNINIPNLPASKIRGIKLTTLGSRKISKKAINVSKKRDII